MTQKQIGKRHSKPRSIAQAMQRWTRKIPDKMELLVRMRREWLSILNGRIGHHTWPKEIKNRSLIINVDDPIWIQELSLMQDELYNTIRSYLRDDRFVRLIRKLRFQNGEILHQKPKTEDLILLLDHETKQAILNKTASIEDEGLRHALQHYLIQSCLALSKKQDD